MSISDDSLTGAPASGDPDPLAAPAHAGDPGPLAVHRFARPAGIRRLQLVTVMAAASLSAALGVWVLLDEEAAVGILVVALALTAAMGVSWFGEPTSSVRVEYGVLVLSEGDREHRVDVAGADLVVDRPPDHRAWRAVVRRPGRRQLVIDATMVDPTEFTQVLGRWRPDLLGDGGRASRGGAPDAP